MIHVLRPPRSQYNVGTEDAGRAARTYAGRVYASDREAQHAQELDLRKRAGEVLDWRPQPRIPLEVDGVRVGCFVPDFLVTLADGATELHETKGYRTPDWKFRWRVFEAAYLRLHLEITYRVIR